MLDVKWCKLFEPQMWVPLYSSTEWCLILWTKMIEAVHLAFPALFRRLALFHLSTVCDSVKMAFPMGKISKETARSSWFLRNRAVANGRELV